MFDEQHSVFLLRKRVVNSLVSEVEIDADRNQKVDIGFALFDLGNGGPEHSDPTQLVVQALKAGIYTRIPDMYRYSKSSQCSG